MIARLFDTCIYNPIENALDVTSDVLTGEVPDKRKVARLVGDGLSVAAVAAMFDVSADVIEAMLEG